MASLVNSAPLKLTSLTKSQENKDCVKQRV